MTDSRTLPTDYVTQPNAIKTSSGKTARRANREKFIKEMKSN